MDTTLSIPLIVLSLFTFYLWSQIRELQEDLKEAEELLASLVTGRIEMVTVSNNKDTKRKKVTSKASTTHKVK